jgi:O-antigen ligase
MRVIEARAGVAGLAPVGGRGVRRVAGAGKVEWQRFRRRVIAQVVFCATPAALLLLRGSSESAGRVFWLLFMALILRLVLLGKRDELLCVLLGLAPFANLLRGFVFYNVVAVLYMAAVLFHVVRSPRRMREVFREYPLVGWFVAYLVGYYSLSFALTGEYSANLRVFDLASAVLMILVIGRSRQLLAASLIGVTISAIVIGLVMLPHMRDGSVERLGRIFIGGHSLGNPVQLGTPLALCFLALVVDGGRWLKLEGRSIMRAAGVAAVFGLLALTTSRAGWAVAAAGAIIGLCVSGRRSLQVLALVGVCAVMLWLLLASPFTQPLRAGLDRTFSSERTVRNRTSGRSDQWVVAYRAVTQSSARLLWGYGPGRGPAVYAEESSKVAGIAYRVGKDAALHSLYMQIGVESGLLGLVPLLFWLGTVIRRAAASALHLRIAFPLTAGVGFALVAATVSGQDTVSGVLLGLGLLATSRTARSPRWKRTI